VEDHFEIFQNSVRHKSFLDFLGRKGDDWFYLRNEDENRALQKLVIEHNIISCKISAKEIFFFFFFLFFFYFDLLQVVRLSICVNMEDSSFVSGKDCRFCVVREIFWTFLKSGDLVWVGFVGTLMFLGYLVNRV
jgi:hypothetical protein